MPDMQAGSGITEELEPIIEYGSAILELCKDNQYNNENWNDRGLLGWFCENLIKVPGKKIPEMLATGKYFYICAKFLAKVIISNDYRLTGKCNYYMTGDLGYGALGMPFAVSINTMTCTDNEQYAVPTFTTYRSTVLISRK